MNKADIRNGNDWVRGSRVNTFLPVKVSRAYLTILISPWQVQYGYSVIKSVTSISLARACPIDETYYLFTVIPAETDWGSIGYSNGSKLHPIPIVP